MWLLVVQPHELVFTFALCVGMKCILRQNLFGIRRPNPGKFRNKILRFVAIECVLRQNLFGNLFGLSPNPEQILGMSSQILLFVGVECTLSQNLLRIGVFRYMETYISIYTHTYKILFVQNLFGLSPNPEQILEMS